MNNAPRSESIPRPGQVSADGVQAAQNLPRQQQKGRHISLGRSGSDSRPLIARVRGPTYQVMISLPQPIDQRKILAPPLQPNPRPSRAERTGGSVRISKGGERHLGRHPRIFLLRLPRRRLAARRIDQPHRAGRGKRRKARGRGDRARCATSQTEWVPATASPGR